jgi:hypothetical protein
MNEKVMLPKEVAEAIENLREDWQTANLLNAGEFVRVTNPSLLDLDESHAGYPIAKYLSADFTNNYPKYTSAIINGYEIARTPEERVLEYYLELHSKMLGTFAPRREEAAEIAGIEKTLDIFGIQIEGINA